MAIRFQQGEDKILNLSILGPGSVPIDLTPATDIRVRLVNSGNGQELAKYALTTQAGYGVLEVDGISSNVINTFIQREDSKTFPVGTASVYVLIQFPDANFPDGFRHEEYNFLNTIRIDQGSMTGENLP